MIETVDLEDKKVVLLGTAHVSSSSVEEVGEAIEKYKPDKIGVELDEKRLESMREKDAWKETDIGEAIREGRGQLLFFNLLLSIYQRKLGEDVEPGAEMVKAVEKAEEKAISYELIDRDIQTTLKRAFNSLNFFDKFRIFYNIVAGFLEKEEVDVEELKESDMINEVLEEFAGSFPKVKEVLIDERDSYMAEKILEAEGGTILAVVGAGHVEGIKKRLEQNKRADIDQLDSIETNLSVLKIAKYAVPSAVILLFLYGVVVLGLGTAKEMFFQWFIFNASFAAVGALASLAHPFTVLVSFLAAPFTSINPALPAGMVASLTENKVRQPKVGDLEALGEIESYRELWRNQATRLLLIFFLVNLGSSIATFIGAGALANLAGLL